MIVGGGLELGSVQVSTAARRVLQRMGGGHDEAALAEVLDRHRSGDWGEITEVERRRNAGGLLGAGQVTSVYSSGLAAIYVITEAGDPPHTRVLTPVEL